MSCSKPLPPFTFDVLCSLDRNQLERFLIVCRPLKNFIERYFRSKPYRVFDRMWIRGGLYTLRQKYVHWHPNRDDYSVQQFLGGQKCSIDKSKRPWDHYEYYSFVEMRPYMGPTVRINWTTIDVAQDYIFNPEHIEQMESIAYLWREGMIEISNAPTYGSTIVGEDFQLILNSPTILQCQKLDMRIAQFSFKDYEILYTVNVIISYCSEQEIDPSYWTEFLEQPRVKPVIILQYSRHRNIESLLDRLSKAFSSAVVPSAFTIVFSELEESLIEFRETNKISGENLELKKGIPVEILELKKWPPSNFGSFDEDDFDDFFYTLKFCYTLNRFGI